MERELTALEQRLYKFLDNVDSHLEYEPTKERWELLREKTEKCKQDCIAAFGVINNGYSLHIELPFDADKRTRQETRYNMRERKLKRALWLLRAKRNKDLRTLGSFRKYVESLATKKYSIYHYPKQGFSSNYLHKRMMEAFEMWCRRLRIAEEKCLKKMEEYK